MASESELRDYLKRATVELHEARQSLLEMEQQRHSRSRSWGWHADIRGV